MRGILQRSVHRLLREQAGMQTIEWLGLGLVVLALMGVMISWFGGDGGVEISALVGQKVKAMVNRLSP